MTDERKVKVDGVPGRFWQEFLCGLTVLYIAFHWTPIIEFLDRLIAVRP